MRVPWDRGGLRTYLVLLALVLAQPRSATLWWGTALLLLGAVLHVYAKGSLRQDQVVSMGGPYRFVRHPFYAANLLTDQSIAIMSGCWPLMVALPIWWLLVYVPAMRREEAHLAELFPDVYPAYQRRLPRLVPFRRPLPARGEAFSWANPNLTSDAVLARAVKLLCYPLMLLAWGELRTSGMRQLSAGDGSTLTILVLLFSLYAVSRMLSRHLRDRRRVLPERLSVPAARAATVLLVLVLAGAVHWAEVESAFLLPLLGALAVATSIALHLGRRPATLCAEGIGLAGLAILCELPWLGALTALAYAGLLLDTRIDRLQTRSDARLATNPGRFAWWLRYSLLIVVGIALAVVKELL